MTRAKPPTSDYPVPPPHSPTPRAQASILGRLYDAVSSLLARMTRVFTGSLDWWQPLRRNGWLHHHINNSNFRARLVSLTRSRFELASLFKSLRFLPSGHSAPLHIEQTPETPPSPYQVFYHLYKPSTPFKKTAPPPPDFSVVVVK